MQVHACGPQSTCTILQTDPVVCHGSIHNTSHVISLRTATLNSFTTSGGFDASFVLQDYRSVMTEPWISWVRLPRG